MKKIYKIVILVVVVLIVLVGGMFWKQGSDVKKLNNSPISMNKVQDGTYLGKVDTILIQVEVEVKVKDSKIEAIQLLKHQTGMGKPAEVVTQSMIEKNTWDVDTISGTTSSSEVIKSAVNRALMKGIKE